MAELRIIECADCGCPRMTRRHNTKYCRACRLLRNIKFFGDRTQKCIDCKQPFAPLVRGEDLCAKCYSVPVSGDPRGTCAFCKEENAPLIDEQIAICTPCAQDITKRDDFRTALSRKIRGYKEGTIPYPDVKLPEKKVRATEAVETIAV